MRILVFGARPESQPDLRRRLVRSGLNPEFLPHATIAELLASLDGEAARMLPVLAIDKPGLASDLRAARAEDISSPIIVLRDGVRRTAAEYLDAGADDVLNPDLSPDEVVARLRAVLRRMGKISAPTVRTGDIAIPLDGSPPMVSGLPVILTPRERDILLAIARNAGRVVSKETIYDALYAMGDSTPFEQVLDVHIFNIRKKFSNAAGERRSVIKTVRGRGYILEVAAPA